MTRQSAALALRKARLNYSEVTIDVMLFLHCHGGRVTVENVAEHLMGRGTRTKNYCLASARKILERLARAGLITEVRPQQNALYATT